MRIFQIITLSELGGAQSVLINLVNHICKIHEVIVIAGAGDGKMFEALDPQVHVEKVPTLVRQLSPLNELQTISSFKKLYNRYRPDLIHLHSSKAGILGRLAFPKRKIVYTVHGFDSIRIAYRKFLPLERLLQYRCSAIVGVSKYDEKNLLQEGITHNVRTIYNGISQPKKLDDNPFTGINRRKGIVLCIARLSPQKKHSLFIEVAKRLPDKTFIWIGNQNRPNFEYPENVLFLGNIPNAGAYICFANLFFLPSNYEGLPIVIIEALASGVPVVASSVGGVTELLDGKNGWAVENSVEKMVLTIQRYFDLNNDERDTISKNARQTFVGKFTIDKMVDGYQILYNEILSNQNK